MGDNVSHLVLCLIHVVCDMISIKQIDVSSGFDGYFVVKKSFSVFFMLFFLYVLHCFQFCLLFTELLFKMIIET